MKLAEALQERADLNRKVEQLRSRIQDNAIMQEGVEPAEDPAALMKQLDGVLDRLEKLIVAINCTNAETETEGVSMTALLAKRDVLKLRLAAIRDTAGQAANLWQRSSGSEIRQLAVLDIAGLQRQADALSQEYRLLDNRIQALNWSIELIEA